jgi:plasmid stabilization system protein ParE
VTPPLTLRPAARAEIDEAYQWYEERRAGLGEEFLRAVRAVLAEVEQAPRRYPVIRNDIRRALLRRFPYSILYIAEPEATIVVACFHGSRDPRRWHERR